MNDDSDTIELGADDATEDDAPTVTGSWWLWDMRNDRPASVEQRFDSEIDAEQYRDAHDLPASVVPRRI